MIRTYGNTPVPFVASWSSEEAMFLAECPHAEGRIAICQASSPGEGRPLFGKPHAVRQRQAIVEGLCDLCGRSLKNRTKVSLSHARSRTHAATPLDILQVEPLLHRECALTSAQHCPSLRRDIRAGSIEIRQVSAYGVQFAVFSEQGTFELTGERRRAISHAKVHLRAWKDRDARWLGLT